MAKSNKEYKKSTESKTSTVTYKLFPSVEGSDLWLPVPSFRKNTEGNGKFALTQELGQKELKYIYDLGNTNIVYKVED